MSVRLLFEAIYEDDRVGVRRLLRKEPSLAGASVDRARLYTGKINHWVYVGDTALHLAAAGWRVEIVELLLATGGNPNSVRNHRGGGPLHYAADGAPGNPWWDAGRQVETIRHLLEAGAGVNTPDANGATALHRAVRTRSAAAVRFLLGAGADARLKNKPGSTAFHLAVQNTGRGGSGSEAAKAEQFEIIREFLLRGVSLRLKDGRGKSVLEWARSGWVREVLGG